MKFHCNFFIKHRLDLLRYPSVILLRGVPLNKNINHTVLSMHEILTKNISNLLSEAGRKKKTFKDTGTKYNINLRGWHCLFELGSTGIRKAEEWESSP